MFVELPAGSIGASAYLHYPSNLADVTEKALMPSFVI